MSGLDAGAIQRRLSVETIARLDDLEAFSSIASTNTHLLAQPPPAPGRFRVAIADHQTSGRGRHDRRWFSPPGSGLYLSLSYTFAAMPAQLPGLTLALGVGIITALARLGIDGVSLKWPNDIVARDGKLGGILTEVQSGSGDTVTVVTGIGLNINLPERVDFGSESGWAHRPVDLNTIVDKPPGRELLAGSIIESLYAIFVQFEALGFNEFVDAWRRHDWLMDREITVDLPDTQITGVAAGVDEDGALLLDRPTGRTRIVSGSILMTGTEEPPR